MSSLNGNTETHETQKSTHVLQTPSRSHDNIFGNGQNGNVLMTPSKRQFEVRSEISHCFTYDKNEKPEKKANGIDEGDKNGNLKEQESEVENIQPTGEEGKVAIPRVRVPPGGFSSRLW